MQYVKVLGATLIALLAFGAVEANAAELVLTKGSYPAKFTMASSHNAVLSASTNVNCINGATGQGSLLSATLMLELILLHKCLVLGGLGACTTAGAPSELIHELHLVLIVKKGGKELRLLLKHKTAPFASFSCAGTAVTVEGSVNALVTNVGFKKPTKSWSENIEVSGGKQLNTEDEEHSGVQMTLTEKTGGGAAEAATFEQLDTTVTLEGSDEGEFVE